MIINYAPQGTPEWLEARIGKMTASHADTIATAGSGLSTYCRQIAGEIYSGMPFDSYMNDNMRVGKEDEEYARNAYELSTNSEVLQVGFAVRKDTPDFGASPDGLVNLDGGVEFKRKTAKCHNDLLLGAVKFESKYVWQCHANMYVFNRDWWDLVSFNPTFKDRSLYIIRIHRDLEYERKLLLGIAQGRQEIEKYLKLY